MFNPFKKKTAALPPAIAAVETVTRLQGIVGNFLAAYDQMNATLIASDLNVTFKPPPPIINLAQKVLEQQKTTMQRYQAWVWRQTLQNIPQAAAATDFEYNALIATLNQICSIDQYTALDRHELINIHVAFRDFLYKHDPEYRNRKFLAANSRLREFTTTYTDNITVPFLQALHDDMQMICDVIRSRAFEVVPDAAFNQALSCIEQFNTVLNTPVAPLEVVTNPIINHHDASNHVIPTDNPAPPLDLQTLVDALPKITVGIITYNCGNKNLPPEAVEQLQAIIATLDTDLIFFSFQESKRALHPARFFENLVERILKRFTPLGEEENPYTLLEYKALYTPTHMNPFKHKTEAVLNFFNLPRAKVAIAFKNDRFPDRRLTATPFSQHTPWNFRERKFNFDNKGGMFNTLSFPNLGDFQINFVGAHLDSENYANGQKQAEALITYATQNDIAHSNVTFIAGDFNIRIHENYVRPEYHRKAAPLRDLIRTNMPTAIAGSIAEWQKESECLKRINIAPLPAATYHKTNSAGHVTYNASRKTHDVGALDLIGFTKSPHSRATVQHQDNLVTILEPLHPKTGEAVSDHKAVVTKYTVLPPITPEEKARLNACFRITPLDNIHRILHDANHPDLIRTYFEYAIAATETNSSGAHHIPYHINDIELIKHDITFIIDHLNALCDQTIETRLYNNLIFGTCEAISRIEGNNTFIQEKFEQLLAVETGSGVLKLSLLKPFRVWLDLQRIERKHYTLGSGGAFFSYSANTRVDEVPVDQQLEWR